MEAVFNFITQYFWLIMIGYTAMLGAIWWRRGKIVRQNYPARIASYKRLMKWFIAAGSIPWLLLGAAQIAGEYKYVFEIFDYWNAGLWTAGFYISAVILGVAANYYVFAKNGAKELSEHPGLLNYDLSPTGWKLAAVAIPLAHVWFLVFAYIMRDQLSLITA